MLYKQKTYFLHVFFASEISVLDVTEEVKPCPMCLYGKQLVAYKEIFILFLIIFLLLYI